jgi:plastocyanin
MDTLDSRALRYTDCFAQKISSPGQIQYQITTMAGTCLPIDPDHVFTINVKEHGKDYQPKPDEDGKQHEVIVRREGQKFVADPPALEITVGDVVLWRSNDPSTPGFTVRGQGKDISFDSSALASNALYTHAFGVPGEYRWVDANGGPVSGVIQVNPLASTDKKECERWAENLSVGLLITVNGSSATPNNIKMAVGQTVFWAVEKASGISITDARFIQKK